MEAYRDQYATMFNNGRKVVVIGISVDADTTQAAWAREKDFPMLFASDPGGMVGRKYGAYDEKNAMDDRSLYVIAPDGTVAYHVRPFRILAAEAYTELDSAIDRLVSPADTTHR
jgi:peroxiredoxin